MQEDCRSPRAVTHGKRQNSMGRKAAGQDSGPRDRSVSDACSEPAPSCGRAAVVDAGPGGTVFAGARGERVGVARARFDAGALAADPDPLPARVLVVGALAADLAVFAVDPEASACEPEGFLRLAPGVADLGAAGLLAARGGCPSVEPAAVRTRDLRAPAVLVVASASARAVLAAPATFPGAAAGTSATISAIASRR
jgi:hypothetical protein